MGNIVRGYRIIGNSVSYIFPIYVLGRELRNFAIA